MSDTKFDGADMTEVIMSKAYAGGASFKGTDLSNAVLDRVNFEKANLQGASFKNNVLSGSTFNDAQLDGADFEDTIIGYIDLQKICLSKTINEEGRVNLGWKAHFEGKHPKQAPFFSQAADMQTKKKLQQPVTTKPSNGEGLQHTPAHLLGALLVLLAPIFLQGVERTIGVNYGAVADDLPPPVQVALFLLKSTSIRRVRLFDANPEILKAFARTGIAVAINVPNDLIPQLTKLTFAQLWVEINILPHVPATNIVRILVGNEAISIANKLLIVSLVPAMETLHAALVEKSLDRHIQISSPHSLGILSNSSPPSTGKFRPGYDTHVLKPLLEFLRATNSPFMGSSTRPHDSSTRNAQLDAIFSALKLLDFEDIEIVIAETGWPSKGDPGQAGVDAGSAAEYNKKLIQHVMSGIGTPLMHSKPTFSRSSMRT
ncbi:hypothetical protein K7X08_035325 [Anisodus acutangulus]|uniref:Glucan endo-1,3-beta-D-glucosidase n=1 Tax=Anisodus acutangulus TaxID=402998 RepID=A0A9Q1R1R0_9SOLA|nr:hypothetical protein K7X08_035325 [Anisodus acutangulus]